MSKRAAAPDRFELYERAAQSPAMQARFLRALHEAPPGAPLILGEDFCGAGAVSRAWVALAPKHRAVCVDHDSDPLRRLRAFRPPRVAIRRADVMAVKDPVDILATLNFSICEWKTRGELVAYLRRARARLRPGGVFVMDIYGGERAFALGTSEVELRGGVRYVWEQRAADPVTGRVVNAMHFRIGAHRAPRWLRDAFVYDWRLWSIPELRDALAEAGLPDIEIYDRLAEAIDGDGAALVRPVASGEDLDEDYVLYLAARSPRRAPSRARPRAGAASPSRRSRPQRRQ